MKIEKLHDEFGARITGADLSTVPEGAALEAIRKAIDEYSFVVFPETSFDDAKQLEMTRALGDPEPDHVAWGQRRELQYFGTIGNVQEDGTAIGSTDKRTVFSTGNNMWHSDASFKEIPADFSIMAAYETPDEGGETLFVSLRAAHARLTEAEKERLDPMIGIHDYVFSRSKVAPDAVSAEMAETLPPVRQRLVRRNPRTGERNLFLGSHLRSIEGMDDTQARPLIDALTEEAVAPEHIYAHKWRPGDFVIWDNRCLIHRGAGYDADKYRRYMRQTRTRGPCNSLAE